MTASKSTEELMRVVIRFAGDSGDGMQLTGDRFTQETADFGNDLSTLPNFPAEIRAPAGTLPGVSSFQIHFADYDILTPGDHPDVLVAMNPAALKANIGDLQAGGTAIVDAHEFTTRNLKRVGYESNPLEDGSLERLPAARDRPDRADRRRGRGVRPVAQGRLARQEHVRPRARQLDVRPADRRQHRVPRQEVRRGARHPRRQHRRPAHGLQLRRDDRVVRGLVRHQARRDPVRPLSQHHRQHRAVVRHRRRRAAVRPAGVPRRLPDHPGVGHPARAVEAQGVRRHDVPGRGRDRRHRRGPRCELRRRARRHDDVGPGTLAQGRDDRPGGHARGAARHHRRAARRPVDRPADQDRAVGPAAGHQRTQRRGAAAGHRAAVTRPTASTPPSRQPGSR